MAKDSLEKLAEVSPQNFTEIEEGLNDEPYHNEKKLLNISFWSNILSWVILVIYVLNSLARIAFSILAFIQNGGFNDVTSPFFSLDGIYTWTNVLMTPATGFMFFLILQALSQGVLILIDIEEKRISTN